MAFLDDAKKALDNYETEHCKTEIVQFRISGGESTLNILETFEFKVKVTNQSILDMKNVKVRVIGTEYADVAQGNGPFGGSAISGAFSLDALQTYTTGLFKGYAKKITSGVKDIVTARIDSWDASLDYILKDLTGAGVAEGRLSKDIMPD